VAYAYACVELVAGCLLCSYADVEVLLLFVERKGRNRNKEKGIKREEEKGRPTT
jgi:hypothetical protein